METTKSNNVLKFCISQLMAGVALLWVSFGFFGKQDDIVSILLQLLITSQGLVCIIGGFGLWKLRKWAYLPNFISGILFILETVLIFCIFLFYIITGKVRGQDFIGLFIIVPIILLFFLHGLSFALYLSKNKGLFYYKRN